MANIKDYGNGKYRVIVCNGRTADGILNRGSWTIEAKSLKAAEKQAAELEYKFKQPVEKDINTEKACLFEDLVVEWRKKENSSYSPNTMSTYNGILKNYMLPVFGKMEISNITKKDVTDYIFSLKQVTRVKKDTSIATLSQKTIRNHFVLLSSLFTYAIDYDMLQENVCSQIKHKPQVDKHEADFYDPDEVDRMLKCIELDMNTIHLQGGMENNLTKEEYTKLNNFVGLMYKTYIYVALASACRRSEMLGLDWKDIDFDKGLLRVRKVSLYTAERGIYSKDKLKNGSPSKVVTLPNEIMDMLKVYMKAQKGIRNMMGDRWIQCDRLFIAVSCGNISEAGGAMNPDTISQWFEKFLKRNDLPKITLHQVRHTSISYLINSNLDINTIAERAGHKDTSVTTGIYGHVFEKNRRECADVMGGLFKNMQ